MLVKTRKYLYYEQILLFLTSKNQRENYFDEQKRHITPLMDPKRLSGAVYIYLDCALIQHESTSKLILYDCETAISHHMHRICEHTVGVFV